MIKKIKGKYKVLSESGKNMGTYKTRAEAEKRLKQIEFFKYKKSEIQLGLFNISKRCKNEEIKAQILGVIKSAAFKSAESYRLIKISDSLDAANKTDESDFLDKNLIIGISDEDKKNIQSELDNLMQQLNTDDGRYDELVQRLNKIEDYARANNRVALVRMGVLE